jgi:hypothetical protein
VAWAPAYTPGTPRYNSRRVIHLECFTRLITRAVRKTQMPPNTRDYQPYEVILTITRRVSVVVAARTPEQAEDEATEAILDGEQGVELSQPDIACEEAYPLEDSEPVQGRNPTHPFDDPTGQF